MKTTSNHIILPTEREKRHAVNKLRWDLDAEIDDKWVKKNEPL